MKVASKYVNDYLMMTTPLVGDIAYNCRVPYFPSLVNSTYVP